MAFALGFAGGFADAATEPEPTPVVIGSGSGSALYRTRWVPRQGQPAPPPIRLAVAVHVAYQWTAAVVRIIPRVRFVQVPPRMSVTASVEVRLRTRCAPFVTTSKFVDIEHGRALHRFTYEQRELAEIAIALTAWQQREP